MQVKLSKDVNHVSTHTFVVEVRMGQPAGMNPGFYFIFVHFHSIVHQFQIVQPSLPKMKFDAVSLSSIKIQDHFTSKAISNVEILTL